MQEGQCTMDNLNKSSLVFAIISFIFSMIFQGMAYWGGSFSWIGFWVGAVLSYFFMLSSIVCMFLNKDKLHFFLVAINIVLISVTMLWTTFIIMAWLSGM
jgi:hypothetical protein